MNVGQQTPHREITVAEIMAPTSVAIVGASEDSRKFGGRILYLLQNQGYTGTILPINPKRDTIFEHKCYSSIKELPQPPDLVIVAVARKHVTQVISDCGDIGAKGVIVVSAGFSEAGDEGILIEQKMLDIARAKNVRIVGPNCIGIVSPARKFALATAVSLINHPVHVGHIGLVSQSGAVMGTMMDRAASQNIGFSHCVSVGNQADLDLCDFVDFMIDDPQTHVICTYVEGIKRPELFIQVAERAQHANKPWLLLKSGKTEEGAATALSHTGSLASDQTVLDAICRKYGIIQIDDFEAMLVAAHLWTAADRNINLRSVAVLSPSGGGCAIAADRLAALNIPLSRFSAASTQKMSQFFDQPVRNPVDIGAANDGAAMSYTKDIHQIALDDPDVGLVLSVLTNAPILTKVGAMVADAMSTSSKPAIAAVLPGNYADGARHALMQASVPYCNSLDTAIQTIDAWYQWTHRLPLHKVARPLDVTIPTRTFSGLLDEDSVKQLLSTYGVPVNKGLYAATPAEAAAMAEKLQRPYVVKVVSEDISHKTEVGGVALHLADPDAVKAASLQMLANIAEKMPQATIKGFLVQEHISGKLELLLGIKKDPQFGMMLAAGAGGIHTEILADIVMMPCPVTKESALAHLHLLKIAPVFAGVRGEQALDTDAIADVMVRLSWLAHDLQDYLLEMDINPLLVLSAGQGCVAVDGRALFIE